MLIFFIRLKSYLKRLRFLKFCTIGHGFTCGPHSNCSNESGSRGAIIIGDYVEIMGSLLVCGEGKIKIGTRSTIRFGSHIESLNSVAIGDYVIISNNVTISDNNNHPTDPSDRRQMLETGFYGDLWHWRHSSSASVSIGNNVWIGHHSTILKGVSIGDGCIIACHAVVTRDVPPYSIVAGNPARVVKLLSPENI